MDHTDKKKPNRVEIEQPTPSRVYPIIDTGLARDNVENDIPDADLQDLQDNLKPYG